MIISDWREVVKMSVVLKSHVKWNKIVLRKLFMNYIKICVKKNLFENNGSICTTLSGGVDSSLCLAIIREIIGWNVPIHTFTTGKDDRHPDIQLARLVAGIYKTEHHELIPLSRDVEKAQEIVSFAWPEKEPSLGDIAVYLTYEYISSFGFKSVISHDGIDELMGGYWNHRKQKDPLAQEEVFKLLWSELAVKHLLPLERKAHKFGIKVIFPYLQEEIVEYVSGIPVWHRTTKEESKIPLKAVARNFKLPPEVVDRKKIGFCDALS